MPIKIKYDVPMAVAGPIAYQAGRGLFEQERDKFFEGRRQFDEQLQQQGYQFERGLDYKYDMARLSALQNQQKMGQQAYEFERGLVDNAASRQASLGIAQAGIDERRLDRQQRMTKDARAIAQQKQQQLVQQGANSAEAILKHPFRSPEQRQQAIDQWLQRPWAQYFGGEFPFTTPFENQPNAMDVGMIDAEIKGMLGRWGTGDDAEARLEEMRGRLVQTDPQTGEITPAYGTPAERNTIIRDVMTGWQKDKEFETRNEEVRTQKEMARIEKQKDYQRKAIDSIRSTAQSQIYSLELKKSGELRKIENDIQKEMAKAQDLGTLDTAMRMDIRARYQDSIDDAKASFDEQRKEVEDRLRKDLLRASAVRVDSIAEAMELPPGTPFIAPDGRLKFRP